MANVNKNKNDESVISNPSPVQKVTTRAEKAAEYSLIQQLKQVENTLKHQLKHLSKKVSENVSAVASLNDILSGIEAKLSEKLDANVAALSKELSQRYDNQLNEISTKYEQQLSALALRVSEAEKKLNNNQCQPELLEKINCVPALEARINELAEANQRAEHSSDAIIFGLPIETKCLRSAFNQVCRSIDLLAPRLKDIFRPKRQTGDFSSVVVAKFFSQGDRNRTLKAFSEYRFRNKAAVNLRTAGFECDGFFYIHESIDEPARKLLQKAVKLKKEKKLYNAFTLRGVVHVRCERNSTALPIKTQDDLDAITANATEQVQDDANID